MYATITTTHGSTEDMREVAVMVAEAMDEWLRQIEGFEGLTMLIDEATGTAKVISFWESEEVAESRRHARLQFRDRITASVNAQVEETVGFEVAFARLPGANISARQLAELLRATERAHGEYERELGERDDDWPSWYARHLLELLQNRGPGGPAT